MMRKDNHRARRTENADTMSEVLRHLAEYAEAVEDAVAANDDPNTEHNERVARGEFGGLWPWDAGSDG